MATQTQAGAAGAQPYILGVNDAELARLGFQHQVWSEAAHALWERAGLTRGLTVLDAGCGPGFTTIDLAEAVGPDGRVLAIDEAPYFIEHVHKHAAARGLGNIQARLGDVQRLDDAGFAPGSVDFAYMRWVLCFVPDPEAVVRGVVRLLKPGATFAVQDYFNYKALALAPRSANLEKIVEAVERSWRARAGDPDIVARLPAIFARCGLELRDLRVHQRLGRPGSMLWQWPTTFFRNFLPELEKHGFLSGADRAAFEAEWSARSKDPESFFFAPPVFDVVGVKRA